MEEHPVRIVFHVFLLCDERLPSAQRVVVACTALYSRSAALTHVLFAREGTQVVELRSPSYLRPHFIGYFRFLSHTRVSRNADDVVSCRYSKWAGLGYRHWDTGTKSPDPGRVITLVEKAIENPLEP